MNEWFQSYIRLANIQFLSLTTFSCSLFTTWCFYKVGSYKKSVTFPAQQIWNKNLQLIILNIMLKLLAVITWSFWNFFSVSSKIPSIAFDSENPFNKGAWAYAGGYLSHWLWFFHWYFHFNVQQTCFLDCPV